MLISPRIEGFATSSRSAAAIFSRDVVRGLVEIGRGSFALIGFVVVGAALLGSSNQDLRQQVEDSVYGWLQSRSDARDPDDLIAGLGEPAAAARATAADPTDLSRPQALVAAWLSKRYRVAPEPISRLVQEAWTLGRKGTIDPTLILAVTAIESRFNPFAQSDVGAQGLMQVMTRIHDRKFEAFGGVRATFDPVTNLRVGAQVLMDCIRRAGGIEAGLRYYVGAANLSDDGGYVDKVLAERSNLLRVASGKPVSIWIGSVPPPAGSGRAEDSSLAGSARPIQSLASVR